MANFEHLIPYILYMECGLPKSALALSPADMFDVARRTGYANDPADAGGHTMCGVTLAAYRQYRKGATVADLKRIPFADWRAILKRLYWDRWQADLIADQSVANMLVDWTWGSGVYGISQPQKLLGVKPDGIVGKITLAAVNAASGEEFFHRLKAERHAYHDRIIARSVEAYAKKIGRMPTEAEMLKHTKYRFRKAWRRRVNGIMYGGFDYDATWQG